MEELLSRSAKEELRPFFQVDDFVLEPSSSNTNKKSQLSEMFALMEDKLILC